LKDFFFHYFWQVSWKEEDDEYLAQVVSKIPPSISYEIWSTDQIYNHEPNLRRDPIARKALWIPEESVIDPFAFPILLLRLAKQKGAKIFTNSKLQAAKLSEEMNSKQWSLEIHQNSSEKIVFIKTKILINCGGNYGDMIEKILFHNREPPFHVTPRKGQFIVYEKIVGEKLSSTVLPIPTLRTKGVLVSKSVFGNIIVGPTAEDQQERKLAEIDTSTKLFLEQTGASILPSLKSYRIIGMYAGLRPATQFRDYQIRIESENSYVCVGGIRSTGLTACMGIAEYVCEQMKVLQIHKQLAVQEYTIPQQQTISHSNYLIDNSKSNGHSALEKLRFQSELMQPDSIKVTHWLVKYSFSLNVAISNH